MEKKRKVVALADDRRRPTARSISAIVLMLALLIFSLIATRRVMEYQSFSQHAFQVMDEFIAAKQADKPLGQFEEEFALLAASDRDLGRLMAIAYTERMGTLRDRDRAIVVAANELAGNDLYRLLKVTSPMFDPSARKRFLNGESVGTLAAGIDLMFNTFTDEQQTAMSNCLKELEGTYDPEVVLGRVKAATSLYTGVTWETCRIPDAPVYRDPHRIIHDTI